MSLGKQGWESVSLVVGTRVWNRFADVRSWGRCCNVEVINRVLRDAGNFHSDYGEIRSEERKEQTAGPPRP